MGFHGSHAACHPRQGLVVNLLLLAALRQLHAEGEWGLFVLVGLFSVLFPVIKLLLLALIWNFGSEGSAAHRRRLRWLAEYSKWSMLDVFVVALLVVSVKLGALAQAHVREGIYCFAASVVLTMLLSWWIGRHANGVHGQRRDQRL